MDTHQLAASQPKKVHRRRWGMLLVASAILASGACSTHKKHSNGNSSPSAANGGADAPGKPTNFSWELADLPTCYDPRDGAEVFVWRTQKKMKCNKTTGNWEAAGGAS